MGTMILQKKVSFYKKTHQADSLTKFMTYVSSVKWGSKCHAMKFAKTLLIVQ